MKIHHFVSGSAVVLAAWLMVTFVHDVSPLQYPKQRRGSPAHAASREPVTTRPMAQDGLPALAAELAATPRR
ncbi:MAG: hypothetical protein NTW21_40845 [Verrucomicrobia bacterium]|nr:hypothetical protein [Verrucomicrobiota bacterium]